MTPGQWQEITQEVESVWGRSSKWVHADRAYPRVVGLSFDACVSAVQDLFLAGTAHAPSMSELAAKARQHQGVSEIDKSRCDHPDWGIVAAIDDTEVGICRVCHVEQTFPRGLLKTPLERGVEDVEVPL